jgi:hypothetical protein
VLAAVATLTTPAAGQETARYDGPIIDMHQHAAPDRNVQSLIAVMDEFHIVKAFLSGSLEDVYSWTAAAPGRFIPSPMFPAFGIDGFPDIDSLRAEYLAGRLHGMGEITSQYVGIAADDPRLEPFFALAEEFDVPILLHSHGTGAPAERFRIAIGRPTRIEEVLVRHPTLRIYIEQSGFPFLEETIALMYRYPNVYGDLSWHQHPREIFEWYLRRLLDAGLGKRLMFGTDGPPSRVGQAVEGIESASFLTDEQKRDIFYNNAARFLRLSKETIAKHHGQ